LKVLTTLYIDFDIKFDRAELIQYVTNLFEHDHREDNQTLGIDIL